MILLFICDICQEDLPLEKFLFYKCGHGYCEGCTAKNKQISCPMCRKRRDHEPFRVYLTPAATTVEGKADAIIRSLHAVGPDSSTESTKIIGNKLRILSRELNDHEATASRLLAAMKYLDDRMGPLFYQLRLEQDEKQALQEKVNLWLPRVRLTEKLEREVKCLKEHLHESKQETARALESNSELRKELEWKDRENAKLRQMIAEQAGVIDVKDAEIARWMKTAEDEAKQAKLFKKKMKVMSKGLPQCESNESDQSLSLKPNIEAWTSGGSAGALLFPVPYDISHPLHTIDPDEFHDIYLFSIIHLHYAINHPSLSFILLLGARC
ncbi:hypothetical protein D9758_012316 [Tetrapyrgos nigripes]|uniref:RING-type domain-containing protein n=1 Tax=Tetrapyrgos nigripes TaxID=182062 RepID=A0A8H5FPE5_9AGAR|nr:hypothetical protein D9758_012316 [Tetrapyrgos nigripes]